MTTASELTGPQLRRLAEQAQTDPEALDRLREVERVDGVPVDLEHALANAEGGDLRERLEMLAQGLPGRQVDPEGARGEAQSILAEDRFQSSDVPRPFRSVLERVGDWLEQATDAIITRFPGGEIAFWIVLGLLVAATAAAVAALYIRRRNVIVAERRERLMAWGREDPRRLEREADAAERDGDLVRAIRLLFGAGLLRLDERGIIEARPSLTVSEAARRLRMPTFHELAHRFEEIVYGNRAPTPEDVRAVREGWQQVLHSGEGRAA